MSDLVVLIPIYDDWEAVSVLLSRLDKVAAEAGLATEVLIVDDASTLPCAVKVDGLSSLRRVQVLQLRRNLGHQRAIAIGLAYAEANLPPVPLVLMDGDGEDEPSDIPRLLEKSREEGGASIVFARRGKRYERVSFRLLYACYRLAYRVLTGHALGVGNFSLVPPALLRRLVVVSEIWNHYAAAVVKARIPHVEIPIDRGRRLAGQSRMNLPSLVMHGLSAISVHADTVGARMLILAAVMILLSAAGIVAVVAVKTLTTLAIPGWATSSVGLLAVVLLQATILSLVFMLMMLAGRNASGFIPSRDYSAFVDRVVTVAPAA